MRILDQANDRPLNEVTLYLTVSEAKELRDSIESMLIDGSHHEHVSSDDYAKEITVAIYPGDSFDSFDARSKKIIEDDA